ncbi:hypothetical protein NPM06_34065, partial [Bacillus cereus]|nr:hypothetical protein [Bacillus cereus]
ALFQGAISGYRSAPVFKAFYEKKTAQGKHYYVCIGAVASKLCYIIYAVLKYNKRFEFPHHSAVCLTFHFFIFLRFIW